MHTRAAIAAAGAGEWDEAEDPSNEALRIAEELDHRLELADIRHLRGRMLIDRGHSDALAEGEASIEEAVDRDRATGLSGRVDIVSCLLEGRSRGRR